MVYIKNIEQALGLPYISYHLKHVNSAVVAFNVINSDEEKLIIAQQEVINAKREAAKGL